MEESMTEIEQKRVNLFLGFAFGISWLSSLIIALTGGLTNSPEIIKGSGITLAIVLLASVYMWGPAIANIITRLITREGHEDLYLGFHLKSNWLYWLIGWFSPGILTILGTVLFFVLFPQYYDSNFSYLHAQMGAAKSTFAMLNPIQFALIQSFLAMLISPLMNFVSTFGEEFGWRGYLQPKLCALGKRKGLLFTGIIWGIWHWPVIMMGYNYGWNYWGFPYMGMLAMVWLTVCLGFLFGWLVLKAHSVWPSVIAHAALNGIASVGLLFVLQPYPTLLGPAPTGVIACLPLTIVALIIFLKIED
jgi:membrane protease YdiL (CAAX protease family)